MFNWFKQTSKSKTIVVESSIDYVALEEELEQLQHLNSSEKDVSWQVYERLGIVLSTLNREDEAIAYLEKSLEKHKNTGEGYKELVRLYNKKRKEAAHSNNQELLHYYLDKLDHMMSLSKDVIRGL